MTIAASIPRPPDHLTATAAPNAIPAAYRHGRHRGDGTGVSVVRPAGGPRCVRTVDPSSVQDQAEEARHDPELDVDVQQRLPRQDDAQVLEGEEESREERPERSSEQKLRDQGDARHRQRARDRGTDPPPERVHPERLDPECDRPLPERRVDERTHVPLLLAEQLARWVTRSCRPRRSRRRRCRPPSRSSSRRTRASAGWTGPTSGPAAAIAVTARIATHGRFSRCRSGDVGAMGHAGPAYRREPRSSVLSAGGP